MATNAQILDNMMARLGSRTAPGLRTKVLFELNEMIRQRDVGPTIPWFCETRLTGSLVANQDYLELPADFSREVELGEFKVRNTDNQWIKLFKVSLERLEAETENAVPGFPEGYALYGNRVYFGPTPDAAYAYKWPVYVRTSPVVDSGAEATNPWLVNFYNLITLEALDVVARVHVQSLELAAKFEGPLRIARDNFVRTVEAREHVNMDYLLGNEEN